MHILPNISRSKDNQTMKFGQLIEYKMRNIFLKKSYTKCGGETSPRHFSKKSKLSISLNRQSKLQTTCFYSYKALLKNKERSRTSLSWVSFCAWFLKKNISLIIFYGLTKFHFLAAFALWDIGQYIYNNNCLWIKLWRHKFWT